MSSSKAKLQLQYLWIILVLRKMRGKVDLIRLDKIWMMMVMMMMMVVVVIMMMMVVMMMMMMMMMLMMVVMTHMPALAPSNYQKRHRLLMIVVSLSFVPRHAQEGRSPTYWRNCVVLSTLTSIKNLLKGQPFIHCQTSNHAHLHYARPLVSHAVILPPFCRNKLRISWVNVQTSSRPNCAPSDHAPRTPGHGRSRAP